MNLQDEGRSNTACSSGAKEKRYDAGSLQQATDDILANMSKTKCKNYKGAFNLFFTVKMLYCEFAGDTTDHVRRQYPEYLATARATAACRRSIGIGGRSENRGHIMDAGLIQSRC
jgi:hypothetical protein